ncbi:cystathionine beta-lyase [Syntrophobotulus glycolicus DSM 8271]|uniref:cysteine-S-conjugate beta-lyase n=1 Tax=Syntrophobotulus glycolicus (strain DSM 8271 / FlGlyR) TaxID=645991 RepID=F0SYG9_SYNGF|nr:aminotransferase class V-fold PLP-dependent enzyme [Syntrophobotulus glycolicus]ADY57081.1 cystathionine beta-lyase [Syntrophobotulus glycolicus DSM 8271]
MKFGTRLIHNGYEMDQSTGALSIPIYQTSTFHQRDIDAPKEYQYSRGANPTRRALEGTIAVLEGGYRGFAFSSGMAAISSALSIFSAGDHLIICEDVYGGTYQASQSFFRRFDVDITFINATEAESVEKSVKHNTKAIFIESPSNPLLKITDIREIVRIAQKHGLTTLIDNTFMTPYLQRPIELGIDIVIHSATKFIGGHSDVVAGLVVVKTKELAKRIQAVQYNFGAVLGPMDSWLLLRGLKTLKVRLDYQQKNAQILAGWLADHPKVKKVYYPGLRDHGGRAIHFGQAAGAGAVLSFEIREGNTGKDFMERVKNAAVAVSLGGVETIISYPVKMSHAGMPRQERERMGITENLIRVSVGLEDIEDLIEDFEQALG